MSELITGQKRSARCTEFTEADVGKNVTVMGWVDTRRDMGKIIFVDLRDRSGIIQVVIDDRVSAEDFESNGLIIYWTRAGWCLKAPGPVEWKGCIDSQSRWSHEAEGVGVEGILFSLAIGMEK